MPPLSMPESTVPLRRRPIAPWIRSPLTPVFMAGAIWLLAGFCWLVIPGPLPNLEPLTLRGREFYRPEHDMLIYILAGIAAVGMSSLLKFLNGGSRTAQRDVRPASGVCRTMSRVIDAMAVVTVLGLVTVIAPEELAARAFVTDKFHHVDFYLMGPLQAFRHSAALGSDVYTQYGSGWILLFSILSICCHLDYVLVMAILPLFGVAYFLSVYALLRMLTGSAAWSWVGLLVCLQLQLFCGTDHPLWITPSSTVLRCPCDMSLAAALLLLNVYRRGAAIAAGGLGALSFLFGTDTGLYIAIALVMFSLLSSCRSFSMSRRLELVWLWGTYVVVVTVGLLIASRGTLWQGRFWTGYFESVIDFGSGFSALPIADVLPQPAYALLLFAILMIYSLTVSSTFAAVARGNANDRELVLAMIGTVGFGSLMLFINRSHPFNLFHPITPACVLLVVYLTDRFPDATDDASPSQWVSQRMLPLTAVLGLYLGLTMNPNVWDYPSAVSHGVRLIRGDAKPQHSQHLAALVRKVKLIEHILREMEKSNRIQIVGEDPTLWLVTLDRPPMGRYCPAVLFNTKQVQRMLDDFCNSQPHVAFVVNYPAIYNGGIPKYFDAEWKLFYRDPEFSIYVSPEFHEPNSERQQDRQASS
jgi:hypothetical protein